MSKYTCDFATVTEQSNKLNAAAEKFTQAITQYQTAITGDLASWTGATKDKFTESSEGMVRTLQAKANKATILAEYIGAISSTIAEQETELTELKI